MGIFLFASLFVFGVEVAHDHSPPRYHSMYVLELQGHCAFFAAGLSLITVETELRLANWDVSNEKVHDFHAAARQNETGESS